MDLTFLNVKKDSVKNFTGIWRSTNLPYDEGESFIIFNENTGDLDVYSFYKDNLDELIIYSNGFNEYNEKINGEIFEQNNNVYFTFYFPTISTHVFDSISENEFQLISKNYYSRKKYYFHYSKVNENNLPLKIKKLLPVQDFKSRKKDTIEYLNMATTEYEIEEYID